MMTADEQKLYNLLFALVGSLRARLNQGLNTIGIRVASESASLVSLAVLLILGCHLFLFLNIALGFWLGSLGGGAPALGFLYLASIYLLLILVYVVVLRARIETSVRQGVARQVHHVTDNINAHLDGVEPLVVTTPYRETYISSEPNPFQALEARRAESEHKATLAQAEVQLQVQYIRLNYADIARRKIEAHIAHAYPNTRWALPLIGLIMSRSKPNSKQASHVSKLSTSSSRLQGILQTVQPYLPYAEMAFNALRPILATLLLSKAQRWMLRFFVNKRKR